MSRGAKVLDVLSKSIALERLTRIPLSPPLEKGEDSRLPVRNPI